MTQPSADNITRRGELAIQIAAENGIIADGESSKVAHHQIIGMMMVAMAKWEEAIGQPHPAAPEAEQQVKPLWDTWRIRALVDQDFKDYGTRWSAMYHGARLVADSYEADRAELHRQLAAAITMRDSLQSYVDRLNDTRDNGPALRAAWDEIDNQLEIENEVNNE